MRGMKGGGQVVMYWRRAKSVNYLKLGEKKSRFMSLGWTLPGGIWDIALICVWLSSKIEKAEKEIELREGRRVNASCHQQIESKYYGTSFHYSQCHVPDHHGSFCIQPFLIFLALWPIHLNLWSLVSDHAATRNKLCSFWLSSQFWAATWNAY